MNVATSSLIAKDLFLCGRQDSDHKILSFAEKISFRLGFVVRFLQVVESVKVIRICVVEVVGRCARARKKSCHHCIRNRFSSLFAWSRRTLIHHHHPRVVTSKRLTRNYVYYTSTTVNFVQVSKACHLQLPFRIVQIETLSNLGLATNSHW